MLEQVQHHFRQCPFLPRPAASAFESNGSLLVAEHDRRQRVPSSAPPPVWPRSRDAGAARRTSQSAHPPVPRPSALQSTMDGDGRRMQQAADPFQALSRDVIIAILGQISFIERHGAGHRNTCPVRTACAVGLHAQ